MSREKQLKDSGESILRKCLVELRNTVMTKCIDDLKGMDFRNNKYRQWKEQRNKDDYFEMLGFRGEEHHKFIYEPFTAWYDYHISCSSAMAHDNYHRSHLEELLKCTQLHVEKIASMYSNHDDPPENMMSYGCPACKWATSCIDNV